VLHEPGRADLRDATGGPLELDVAVELPVSDAAELGLGALFADLGPIDGGPLGAAREDAEDREEEGRAVHVRGPRNYRARRRIPARDAFCSHGAVSRSRTCSTLFQVPRTAITDGNARDWHGSCCLPRTNLGRRAR
jgi:hypothetical protein